MFLSKIWFVLVGLLAGVAMTAAFVAPRPADRRIEQLEGQRLDRAQYAAEQMLKTDAHLWIDYVAKLGRDAVLADALDSATKGAGEARMLHETVRGRLKALIPDLAAIGLEAVGATDGKGRVIARLGVRENDYNDGIAGTEVVADALRGYSSDDVWGAGGKVLRVAAAPVASKGRDKIVGVIFVGAETGKRLAEKWKKSLGVDVAVLLKKQVLSSTVGEAFLATLPDQIEQHRQEIAELKRTRAISLPMGSDRLLAVVAPFTGQAQAQDAYYVVMAKKAPASDPFALLSSTAADDLKWGRFPWLPLGGGIVAILVIGLWLQRWETEGPLARLRRDLQKMSRGELQKLADTTYPGKIGGVARDVNAAMERYTHAPTPVARTESQKMNISALLDGADTHPGPPNFRTTPTPFTPPVATASPFASSSPGLAPPPSMFTPASPAAPVAPPRSPFVAAPPPAAAPSPFAPVGMAPPPPPPATGSPFAPTPPTRPPLPPPPARPAAPMPVAAPSPVPGDSVDLRPSTAYSAEMDDEDNTSKLGAEEKTKAIDTVDPEEAHIREVYAEYVSARQRTGEGSGSLTLDKFRAKLASNKEQLIAKYGCRTARFSVYIKDGKAAIKATPVRD
jgi:hypothetical protein